MREIWKDIEGYEGLYQVSNLGRIKSMPKMCGFRYNNERILKNNTDSYGYLYVALCKNKNIKIKLVHRLVAEAFIENKYKKPQVNHKDGIKVNNKVSNLEWCSDKENKQHGILIGLYRPQKGKRIVKKINQYDIKGNLIKSFKCAREINNMYGYSVSHIHKCCKGIYNTSYGYIWRYNETDC